MRQRYKAIIIGCGRIAGQYQKLKGEPVYSQALAYTKTSSVEIVEYIDKDIAKARSLARRFSSNNYGTDILGSINRHNPDIVSICTPDQTHFSITKQILFNRIRPRVIFIEKPVCCNRKEFNDIKVLALKKNVTIVVNHTRRFDIRYQQIKNFIARNRFGPLVRTDVFYYGGWLHNAVHLIDILVYLFEDDLLPRRINGCVPTSCHSDPTFSIELSFKYGKTPVYFHAFDAKYYQLFELDFKFQNARLRIENFEKKLVFEQRIINRTGEKILTNGKLVLKKARLSPLQAAIKSIVSFLDTNDPKFIRNYTLPAIEKSMGLLWKGKKLYEKAYK